MENSSKFKSRNQKFFSCEKFVTYIANLCKYTAMTTACCGTIFGKGSLENKDQYKISDPMIYLDIILIPDQFTTFCNLVNVETWYKIRQ